MASIFGGVSPNNFSRDDLKFLQQLGFYCWDYSKNCEWSGNVQVVSEAQQKDQYTRDPDNYIRAFRNLASVNGSPYFLDSSDLIAFKDPKILANMIEHDPAFAVLEDRHAMIYGKKEIPQELFPRHFRRFMTYTQLAINFFFKKEIDSGKMKAIKPNGKYDLPTKLAIAKIQKRMSIKSCEGHKVGECIGRGTIKALVMRLKYSKADIANLLIDDWKKLNALPKDVAKKGFRMTDMYEIEGAKDVFRKIKKDIFLALQWMGWINPSFHLWLHKYDAAKVMISHLCKGYSTCTPGTSTEEFFIGKRAISWLLVELSKSK